MTTRETILSYFAALAAGGGWQDHFAPDASFSSYSTPSKEERGRDAFLDSTRGFYRMIDTVDVLELVTDGDAAGVRTRYRLRPPGREPFTSDVAEFFTVVDGRVASLAIYFDSVPYAG